MTSTVQREAEESSADAAFAYERLAGELAAQIRAGTLRAGERIPSVRSMGARFGVSVTTVLQAYRHLEMRRMIEARPRSGFYVLPERAYRVAAPRVSSAGPGPTPVTTSELIEQIVGAGSDAAAVPLGAAMPDPRLLPLGALTRSMAAALRRDAAGGLAYANPAGAPELRREIAKREWGAGRPAAPGEVLVTCGAGEALSLALRATTEPGDVVAVESPSFFGVLQAIEALGRRALEIPTCPLEGLDVGELEAALARHRVSACIATPNFHNPIGSLMPDGDKERLVRVLAERDVPLIEDDTFGELAFEGPRPQSLRAWDAAGGVIRCGSFSKTLAPGYRTGWIVAGERWMGALRRHKVASTVASATPPQLAIAEYLAAGRYDRHLAGLRRVLRHNVARLSAEVAARFPEGTQLSRPRGGFLLWIRLPRTVDSLALHEEARRAGISISPGPIFSASGAFRNYVRLSAGHPWSARTERALDALAGMVAGGAGSRTPPASQIS